MARTIAQIYDSLVAFKESAAEELGLTPVGTANYETTTAALDSGSKVGIWRLWLYVVALGTWTLEKFFDTFQAEVDAKLRYSSAGTAPWFVFKSKAFQYGDPLLVNADYVPYYAVLDPTKQIVKYAAAVAGNRLLQLRVSKQVSGAPAPLSNDELASFNAYINNIKPAGLPVTVVSRTRDALTANVEVHYNALYSATIVEADCRAAVSAYLNSLPFNGIVEVQEVIDAIQAVNGVQDVKLLQLSAMSYFATTSEIDGTVIFYQLSTGTNSRRYETRSGSIVLESASTFTLISE